MSYVFDLDTLARFVRELAPNFSTTPPFPHAVMDAFLRPDSAAQLARVFPGPDDAMAWDRYNAEGFEVKRGSGDETRFPAPLRQAVHDLNAGPFIRFLEDLTGIPHLLPDPNLTGGGLHLSLTGNHLGVHADFNWHAGLQLHRRLNLLVYLGPETWQDDYGGALELWATDASERICSIPPLFNRAVLFATRSDTFHGHPVPWAAPLGMHRQSLALYYYSSQRPADELREPHGTLYKGYHV